VTIRGENIKDQEESNGSATHFKEHLIQIYYNYGISLIHSSEGVSPEEGNSLRNLVREKGENY
jgi:hypothetical protein